MLLSEMPMIAPATENARMVWLASSALAKCIHKNEWVAALDSMPQTRMP